MLKKHTMTGFIVVYTSMEFKGASTHPPFFQLLFVRCLACGVTSC